MPSGLPSIIKRERGRPSTLTSEITKAICANLELAMPMRLAAEAEGISEDTVYDWVEKGKQGREPFAAFYAAATRARAKAAKNLTARALAGGKGSSQSTWFLERRYREDYGQVQKMEISGADGGPIQIQSLAIVVGENERARLAYHGLLGAIGSPNSDSEPSRALVGGNARKPDAVDTVPAQPRARQRPTRRLKAAKT